MTISKGRPQFLAYLIISLILMTGSVFFFRAAFERMDRRLREFTDSLFTRAEDYLGFRLEYSSVSPSLFRYLEIRDLRAYDGETGNDLLFINRLRIYYSLSALIRSPESALTRISIENSLLTYDPENEPALGRLIQKLGTGGGGAAAGERPDLASFSGPEILGRNLTLVYRQGGREARMERLYFSLRSGRQNYQFSLRGRGSLNLGPEGIFRTGRGDLQLWGTLNRNLQESETTLVLRDFDSNLLTTSKISLQFSLGPESLKIRKIQDRAPYDLTLEWEREINRFSAVLISEKFIPSNYLVLQPDLAAAAPWLNVSVTGEARGSWLPAEETLTYQTDLDLGIPANRYLPLPLQVKIQAEGDRDRIKVRRLDVASRRGSLFFTGGMDLKGDIPFPEGTLQASNLALGDYRLSGLFYLNRMAEYDSVQSPWLSLGGVGLKDTSLEIRSETGNEEPVLDLVFHTSSSDADWENSLSAEGSLTLGGSRFFQLLLSAENFPLEKVAGEFLPGGGPQGLTRELTLSTQGVVSSDFRQFSFNASRFHLFQYSRPENRLEMTVTGNEGGISFRNLSLNLDGRSLEGSGSVNWSDPELMDYSLGITYRNVSYSLEGSYQPGAFLQFTGNYGLEGQMLFQERGFTLALKTRDLPLPLEETPGFSVSLDLYSSYLNTDSWHLLVNRCTLSGIPSPRGESWGSVAGFSGQFSPDSAVLYSLRYEDPYAPLEGNGELSYRLSRENPMADGWIQLRNPGSQESYDLRVSWDSGNMDAGITVREMPLYRAGEIPVTGFVSGSLSLGGSPADPEIRGDVTLRDGRMNETPVGLDVRFLYGQRSFRLERLNVRYLNQNFRMTSGFFDPAAGTAVLSGDFSGTMQQNPFTARADLMVQTPRLSEEGRFSDLTAGEISGSLHVNQIVVQDRQEEPWTLSFLSRDGILSFQGGPSEGITGSLSGGSFQLTLLPVLPLSFQATGILSDGNIDARMDRILINFEGLQRIFRIPGFIIDSGEALGSLELKGPVNDPDLYGSLTLTKVNGGLNILNSRLKLADTTIQADQKTLTIENLIVESSSGAAIMNCEFNLDHLLPFSYDLYLETVYNRDLELDMTLPGIQIDGFVRGYLNVQGDMDTLKILGDLRVHSATLTLNNQINRGDSRSEVETDIHVTLGNNNTFYWPSRNFPILKTFAESGEELFITSNTTNNSFGLKGRVVVKGGEIFYFRRNFYLQDGILVFNENQDRFDPILNARAVIREVDENGELVRIYLVADNMSLLNFNPRFESDPLKSNQDIMALLGGNLFDSQDNNELLNNAIMLTSDVVSQFGFFQNLQDSVMKNLRLDMFSLRSQIVPNLIRDKFLPDQEREYMNDASLAKYLDNTTLYIGKYFGNNFFLQGIIQMDYYGSSIDNLYFYPKFNIDTEVTLEWKSPVALIELSLYPDFLDPSDPLITSSLSLSWSFSY